MSPTGQLTLVEKLKALQDLLISRATWAGPFRDEEYRRLRTELLNDPLVCDKLPRFVSDCRDLEQFWAFIKHRSSTYQGRREYLWSVFSPLLDGFDQVQAPSDERVAEALTILNSDTVHEAWRRASLRRLDDPGGAITAARSLLETVCKHILDDLGVDYQHHFDLPKLYKLTAQALHLAPSQQSQSLLRQVLGAATTLVEGIGAMRNLLGDAHGKGVSSARPEARHSEFAVNVAGAVATFLVETWQANKSTAI